MKNAILLFLVFTCLSSFSLFAQKLTINPEHPVAGEKVRISYDPTGTTLEGKTSVTAGVFQFALGEVLDVAGLELQAEGGRFSADMEIKAGAQVAFILLVSEDGESDNNQGEGYHLLVYDAARQAPVPGAYATLGIAYTMAGEYGMNANPERAIALFKQEFERNPEARKDPDIFMKYIQQGVLTGDEAVLEEGHSRLKSMKGDRRKTEEDWLKYYEFASLVDGDKASSIKKTIIKKYPKGQFVLMDLVERFSAASTPVEQEAIFLEYEGKAGPEDAYIPYMISALVQSFSTENAEKFERYAARIEDKAQLANLLNNLAWTMAGEGLDGEASTLDKAEKLSRMSLEKIEARIGEVPEDDESLESLKETRANIADTYALILYRLGKYEQALEHQQIFMAHFSYENPEANERYAAYLEKVKGAGPTLDILEMLIRGNKGSARIKEQYQRLFDAYYPSEPPAGKKLEALELQALEEAKKEMKASMLDEEAPLFTLKDLEGTDVSLADLKGKTVVVDFWATWCGPCVASFPGMQMALDQFRDDPNVVFLFINTWERSEDKRQTALDFLSEKGYAFRVLLDEENKVVGDYGVEGIPTKFIVDGSGRIRFRSEGFGGDADKLVEELGTMIRLAAEASKK